MQLSKVLGISSTVLTRHPAKLECLLERLLEQGLIDSEDLSIMTSSNFKRGYVKDILSVKFEKTGDYGLSDSNILAVEVAREGLYDMLPKAIFHEYSNSKNNNQFEENDIERQKIKDEEKAARRFFYPFEQEFFRKRIEIEAMEQKNQSGFLSPLQNFILESIWPAVKDLNFEQKSIFFYMLPLAHKIAGNIPLITKLFNILLKEKVYISTIHKGVSQIKDELESTLGNNSILGFDFVPGAEVQNDLPSIDICIGPVDIAAAPDYLPGGAQERLISLLCDNFLPFDLDTNWRVIVNPGTDSCTLGDTSNFSILGYSSVLEI